MAIAATLSFNAVGATNYEIRLPSGANATPATIPVGLTLAAATLSSVKQGKSFLYDFSTLLEISGDNPPAPNEIVWSSSGLLPDGLSLSSTGGLSGTTTTSGVSSFSITATSTDTSVTTNYSLSIDALVSVVPSKLYSSRYSAYLVDTSSQLWGTGRNSEGQFGNGSTSNNYGTWVKIATNVKSVGRGNGSSTLVVKNDGTLWVTGSNGSGQLGLGSGNTKFLTLTDTGATNVKKAAGGYNMAYYLSNNGDIYSAGSDTYGQLANSGGSKTTWTFVASGYLDIEAGYSHLMARNTSGQLMMAGQNNQYQLSTGNQLSKTSLYNTGRSFNHTASFGQNTLGLSGTTLYAIGYNFNGTLGDGATTSPITSFKVVASGVSKIYPHQGFNMYVNTSGKLYGTGSIGYNQIGLPNSTYYSWTYTGMNNVADVAPTYWASLVLKNDGTLWGTGNLSYVGGDSNATTWTSIALPAE